MKKFKCHLYWRPSSSRMRVINHNWSATKQRLHPQSIGEISRHSVLSGGQDSTMWNIVWVSTQGHRSVSVNCHFLLQAPQCARFMRKWFSRDRCCRGRSKPCCRIVGSHTMWELTTSADFQLCVHRLLMSIGRKSSHSGFLDVSRSNGGLRISGRTGQLLCPTTLSTSPSVAALPHRAGGSMEAKGEVQNGGHQKRGARRSPTVVLNNADNVDWGR